MKKIPLIAFTAICLITLTGCGGCPGRDEVSCKEDKTCVNIYKPCNKSDIGCKENKIFTECRTKQVKDQTKK